ncbi:MAG: DUF4956 domain-containing protein [Saprospiraceae bacterium]|nr:DUF4956 domain-containing protein [Saprospiraceae bacterium]
MFDLSNLSNSAQQTSLALIAFASLMSLGLSLLLVFTYEKTSREVVRPDHYIQSLLLFAIVTTTIMQSIGDSLARSFGIFGALAIIRFRSRISNPRDVAFVFATMAVGIACGVHSFINGIIGTVLFCLVVFLLRLTPFSQKQNLIGTLRFDITEGSNELTTIQALIKQFARSYSLKGYRVFFANEKRQGTEYEYTIKLKDEMQGIALAEALKKLNDIKEIRLSFNDTYESPIN